VVKTESYKKTLVLHACSKSSVCKDDRDGNGSYNCDWEFNWDKTSLRRKVHGKERDAPYGSCKDMETSFIDRELEESGDDFIDEIKFKEVDGDHNGVYAYGEVVKEIILLTWIPKVGKEQVEAT
jgi:hypothetical protein